MDKSQKAALCPKLREDVDLTQAGLSIHEGFVASRLDGNTRVSDLALILNLSEDELSVVLRRMESVGLVVMDGALLEKAAAPKPKTGGMEGGDPEYDDFVFPEALMQDPGSGLDEADRKKILWHAEHLEAWTHYDLLQVDRQADAKAIKRSYFLRSKEWHPDRFRMKNPGIFEERLSLIYRRIQEAYAVLSDPKARDKYNQENVHLVREKEIAEGLALARRRDRDAKREAERDKKRRAANPMRQRIKKAQTFFSDAEAEYASGNLANAVRCVKMALTFDSRAEYQALLDRLEGELGAQRIVPLMRKGRQEEGLLEWDDAIATFQEAVKAAPDHAPAHQHLAYCLVFGKDDYQTAGFHAQRAARMLPDNAEAQFVLGLCYDKEGNAKAAARCYARTLELKPNHNEAKRRLREKKWGF